MGMSKYDELVTQVLNYLDNRDWDSAYSLLKNKELQGDAAAIAVLGEFYINGIGIPEDVEMGIEMLKRAIDAGCAEATGTLATLYLQGEKVPTNERLAINYIKQGADMGNSVAMGKMASVYLYGSYGVQDNRIALEWAQKAAKLGDPLGMECLADPFEEFNLHPGYGMLEEAYFWACKGVEKGDLDCHMLVAWFYEMGNVVNQDYDMAYKYFRIAADNGHEMSAELIKRYRKNIFGNYYIPQ